MQPARYLEKYNLDASKDLISKEAQFDGINKRRALKYPDYYAKDLYNKWKYNSIDGHKDKVIKAEESITEQTAPIEKWKDKNAFRMLVLFFLIAKMKQSLKIEEKPKDKQ